ncbi:MAG TPA: hypothetical protein VJ717_14265 [Gemmatimonadaceae bacterium]|nr:hypothetical protein [Gemmatimonadaceae bacterium]
MRVVSPLGDVALRAEGSAGGVAALPMDVSLVIVAVCLFVASTAR